MKVLKRYNTKNEILFIGDNTVVSDKVKIYHVPIDEGDRVSRQPICNNSELYPLISSVVFEGKDDNIRIYEAKQKKRKNLVSKILQKMHRLYERYFCVEYQHPKTYDVADK